jgi:hypothetical protein
MGVRENMDNELKSEVDSALLIGARMAQLLRDIKDALPYHVDLKINKLKITIDNEALGNHLEAIENVVECWDEVSGKIYKAL